MTAALLDANVIVYAADRTAGRKHERAKWLMAHVCGAAAAVSTQVLSEYANVTTHPHKLALDSWEVATSVRKLALDFTVLQVTPETIVRALEARARWRLSYYDAQIWASAALAGIPVVLSEDFSDGLVLGPVRFVDPFAPGFDIADIR